MSPRSRSSGVGREGQREHCDCTRSTTTSAGSSRRARRTQKRAEVDPVASRALLEQQRGDEEPGEHEEHVDAEETALEPPDVRRGTAAPRSRRRPAARRARGRIPGRGTCCRRRSSLARRPPSSRVSSLPWSAGSGVRVTAASRNSRPRPAEFDNGSDRSAGGRTAPVRHARQERHDRRSHRLGCLQRGQVSGARYQHEADRRGRQRASRPGRRARRRRPPRPTRPAPVPRTPRARRTSRHAPPSPGAPTRPPQDRSPRWAVRTRATRSGRVLAAVAPSRVGTIARASAWWCRASSTCSATRSRLALAGRRPAAPWCRGGRARPPPGELLAQQLQGRRRSTHDTRHDRGVANADAGRGRRARPGRIMPGSASSSGRSGP